MERCRGFPLRECIFAGISGIGLWEKLFARPRRRGWQNESKRLGYYLDENGAYPFTTSGGCFCWGLGFAQASSDCREGDSGHGKDSGAESGSLGGFDEFGADAACGFACASTC